MAEQQMSTKKAMIVLAIIAGVAVGGIAALLGAGADDGTDYYPRSRPSVTAARTVEMLTVPDIPLGTNAAVASDILRSAGFDGGDFKSLNGKGVWLLSNWTVMSVPAAGQQMSSDRLPTVIVSKEWSP